MKGGTWIPSYLFIDSMDRYTTTAQLCAILILFVARIFYNLLHVQNSTYAKARLKVNSFMKSTPENSGLLRLFYLEFIHSFKKKML